MEILDGHVAKTYYNMVMFCLVVGPFNYPIIKEIFIIIFVNQIVTLCIAHLSGFGNKWQEQ